MASIPKRHSIAIPFLDKIIGESGNLTNVWSDFFRSLFIRLNPLGVEKSFQVVDNTSTASDITELRFDKRLVSAAWIEFLIQRVTTGESPVELVEQGSFKASYNPTSDDWNIHLIDINNPDNSGVDFTILANGQVQYTSTDVAGINTISVLHHRVRTLAGKNKQYSSMGIN